MSKKLRAVKPGEKAAKPLTVAEAAATGDQLATLLAMRDRVARTIADEATAPRDLGTLTKRLDDIMEKIRVLQGEDESSPAASDGGRGFDLAAL